MVLAVHPEGRGRGSHDSSRGSKGLRAVYIDKVIARLEPKYTISKSSLQRWLTLRKEEKPLPDGTSGRTRSISLDVIGKVRAAIHQAHVENSSMMSNVNVVAHLKSYVADERRIQGLNPNAQLSEAVIQRAMKVINATTIRSLKPDWITSARQKQRQSLWARVSNFVVMQSALSGKRWEVTSEEGAKNPVKPRNAMNFDATHIVFGSGKNAAFTCYYACTEDAAVKKMAEVQKSAPGDYYIMEWYATQFHDGSNCVADGTQLLIMKTGFKRRDSEPENHVYDFVIPGGAGANAPKLRVFLVPKDTSKASVSEKVVDYMLNAWGDNSAADPLTEAKVISCDGESTIIKKLLEKVKAPNFHDNYGPLEFVKLAASTSLVGQNCDVSSVFKSYKAQDKKWEKDTARSRDLKNSLEAMGNQSLADATGNDHYWYLNDHPTVVAFRDAVAIGKTGGMKKLPVVCRGLFRFASIFPVAANERAIRAGMEDTGMCHNSNWHRAMGASAGYHQLPADMAADLNTNVPALILEAENHGHVRFTTAQRLDLVTDDDDDRTALTFPRWNAARVGHQKVLARLEEREKAKQKLLDDKAAAKVAAAKQKADKIVAKEAKKAASLKRKRDVEDEAAKVLKAWLVDAITLEVLSDNGFALTKSKELHKIGMYRKALAAAQVKESDWKGLKKKNETMMVFAARAKLLALRVRAAISNDEDAEYKSKAKVGTTFLVEWMLAGNRMTKLSATAITNAINAGATALEAVAGDEMDVDDDENDENDEDDEDNEDDEDDEDEEDDFFPSSDDDEENLSSRRNSLSESSSSSLDSRPSKRGRTSSPLLHLRLVE